MKDRAIVTVIRATCLWILLPLGSIGQFVSTTDADSVPQAPPPAPPVEVAPSKGESSGPVVWPQGSTPYSIGSPTDEEQLYLEYINRARANPPAEGLRLAGTTDAGVLTAYAIFSVDTNLLKTQLNAVAPTPPVAMNAQLTAAARGHSQDMFANAYQSHTGSDNSTFDSRITAQGYSWSTCAENVYAYSLSVFYGHAGFEVDWGSGTGTAGGMQTPPGHRNNIHSSAFREVGVGVVDGVNGSFGPQFVTQDFGTHPSATPLITGVVYYDLNGNGFYDVGEGIGGVTVQVPGSTYYATTANSGGYTVPVTSNGSYAMVFSSSGLSTQTIAQVTNQCNVKVDFVPAYSPPAISGPNPAALSNSNAYAFTTVGAATNYLCVITRLSPYTAVEGAENGSNYVTIVSSPGYAVLASDVKASGSYSFHFCHPVATPQILTLNASLQPRTNGMLIFAKRLGWAAPDQVARAQISTNSGSSWQNLWSQAGSDTSGDTSFSKVTNSLSAFAGVSTKIRFVYDFVSGSYYQQTSSGVGLYLDDIAITNADQALSPVTNSIPAGNLFAFVPTNTGNYSLSVCAQLPGRTLPWGPVFRVAATNLPAMAVQFMGQTSRTGSQFQANFNVTNYQNGALFTVLRSTNLLSGNWTTDTLASVQTIVSNTQFRVSSTTNASQAFFRVRVN